MKRCSVCKDTKALTEFHKNRTSADGLQSTCKPCSIRRATISSSERYRRLKGDPNFSRLIKEIHLRRAYGITHEQFDRMVEVQEGRCALCGRANRRLVVDHNHDTGRVRALLCDQCNVALAMMGENPSLLREAAAYLEHHKEN